MDNVAVKVVKNEERTRIDYCQRELFGTETFANVTFFEHSNYEGSSRAIGSNWAYSSDRCWNDKISSISVPRGWKVVVYEHDFGGRSITLTSDWTVNRWNDFWNDRMSSIEVIPPTNPYGYQNVSY
jgi:hypothetical protein